MGTLMGIVESADVAPSADAAAASEKWEAAGKATLGRWDAIQTNDVRASEFVAGEGAVATLEIGGGKDAPLKGWATNSELKFWR